MMLSIETLHQEGLLSELAYQFAMMLKRLTGDSPENALVLLGAAWALEHAERGHVCVDISSTADTPVTGGDGTPHDTLRWPDTVTWLRALSKSPLVSSGNLVTPLVLDAEGRLYLHRFFTLEKELAAMIHERLAGPPTPVHEEALYRDVAVLFNGAAPSSPRVIAAMRSATQRLSVITGGPGAGKTTLLTSILVLLDRQFRLRNPFAMQTALVAPTGKAAQRMTEALARGLAAIPPLLRETESGSPDAVRYTPVEASTIHRALAPLHREERFSGFQSLCSLTADVVVVDEASMVDLALMHDLLRHIKPEAHVILLGDKDQLASVESGAVLADIAEAATIGTEATPLNKAVVQLVDSFRFKPTDGIGSLARAVNEGSVDAAVDVLRSDTSGQIEWIDAGVKDGELAEMVSIAKPYLALLYNEPTPAETLRSLRRFRVLTPHRTGAVGVRALNHRLETQLEADGLIRRDRDDYVGRPIMVIRNDYSEKLYNGDVGIVVADGNTRTAAFEHGEGVRFVSPSALPEVETVFAMTVHKSQGAEFDHVLLMMPDHPTPVWTRELLYTAVTRAKRRLTVIGTEAVLRHAVQHKTKRASGLKDRLLA